MAETKVDHKERKTLKVKWVGEPQPFGDGRRQLLRFNCYDGIQYEAFVYALYPFIQEEAEFDADTELRITTTADGRQFQNWVVTQIYKDGEPVAEMPARTRQYRGRDEDRVDQRTFVMEVGADLRAGIREKSHPFATARETVMASWIKLEVKEVKTEPTQPKLQTQPATAETPMTAKVLMAWALTHGKEFGPSWVRKTAGISPTTLITDEMAREAYLKIKKDQNWA